MLTSEDVPLSELTVDLGMGNISSDTASLFSDQEDNLPLLETSKRTTPSLARRFLIGVLLLPITALAIILASREQKTVSSWKGFEHIENYFAFGDSWTDTHFHLEGPQPSFENPLGNPAFPGRTSSNGVNYVGYLTTMYNLSFVKTYGLGFSGATIDANIDPGLFNWLDLTHRVQDFVQYFTSNGTAKGWQSENTLFSTFYGINDFCVFNKRLHDLDQLFAIYERNIEDLYMLSARNFFIVNLPPIDQSPLWKTGFHDDAATIEQFNDRIRKLIRRLRHRYRDITIFEYDVHDLVRRVMQDAKSVSLTARYKNTTGYCAVYEGFENTTPSAAQIKECEGLEPNDFLWLNSLHVTEPLHQAMAAEISQLLSGS